MKDSNKTGKWIARTASVLLCLTLLSAYLLCSMFAKYTVESQAGDAARVAEFHITAANVEEKSTMLASVVAALAPGEQTQYGVNIVNDSEVAVSFDLTAINKSENLPLTMSLEESEETGTDTLSIPAGEEKTWVLVVEWPNEPEAAAPAFSGKVDLITLELKVVQVD